MHILKNTIVLSLLSLALSAMVCLGGCAGSSEKGTSESAEVKNAKYQDHGYYVATGRSGVRVKVRDDGKQPILIYREGKRLEATNDPIYQRAEELQVVMADIKELEKRIARTSLEINKYQKRLDSR